MLWFGLGFRGIFLPIIENEMEKNMENEMETGIIQVLHRVDT